MMGHPAACASTMAIPNPPLGGADEAAPCQDIQPISLNGLIPKELNIGTRYFFLTAAVRGHRQ